MLTDKMVRLRFRRDSPTQPIWVFLGKVVRFSNDWIAVDGKGVLIYHRDTFPPERRTLRASAKMTEESWTESEVKAGSIDEERRILVFPREAIANIRILPDDFDMEHIRLQIKGHRIDIAVKGGPSTAVGEMFED